MSRQPMPSRPLSSRPLPSLRVALGFLTRIPVGRVELRDGDLARAASLFPVVGLVVAAVGIGVRAAVGVALGPVAGAIVAVAAMVAVTGAFHEDGLADSVDGLWGGTTPAQRIEIMRDSRLGTYGTTALFFVLAIRVSLLAPLDLATFARAVVAGHVLGRAAGVAVAWVSPPASEAGHGAAIADRPRRADVVLVVIVVGVVATAAAGIWAPVPLGAAAAGTAVVGRLARRRVGGITGDLCGAANQVAHVLVMAGIVALARAGMV